MLKPLLCSALMFALPLTVQAQDKSQWPEGSAMHTGLTQKELLENKQAKASELVGKIRTTLQQQLPRNGQYLADLLQEQQGKWLSYVDATCMLVGQMTGAGGSWPSVYALNCASNMADQRLFKLTNTLQCMKRHAKHQRRYEIPDCLYQSYSVTY
ncbi:lysozyme inhibitor LprI family protein [Shewanella sp. YIC-542]|uniref:lysozyme inhibitor LprI family protein n=1 Tax=Shewanella mytili TaxID=3377111 RepID=UPI00398E38A9